MSMRSAAGSAICALCLSAGLVTTGMGATENAPPRTVHTPAEISARPEWTNTLLRRAHLPPYSADMTRAALAYGANVVTANLEDWVYVAGSPAGVLPTVDGAAAEAKIKEFVDICHAGGAKAVAYMNPVYIRFFTAEFQEKWGKRTAAGKTHDPQRGCYNGPFGDFMIKQIGYVAEKCGLDGVWFDGYNGLTYCYCDYCQGKFGKASGGKHIPATFSFDDPVAREYADWYQDDWVDFTAKLTRELHKVKPDFAVMSNAPSVRDWAMIPPWMLGNTLAGWKNEAPIAYNLAVDVPCNELWWIDPGDSIHQTITGHYTYFASGEKPGSVWVMFSANGTIGSIPKVELLCRFANAVAVGEVPEVVEPMPSVEHGKWALDFIKEREAYLLHEKALRWAAVLVSNQTRENYAGSDPLPKYMEQVFGAYKSLTEEHCPFSLITELDLENNNLDGYKVLVLPNAACLSDRAVFYIREFVKNGGGLVATEETSLYDHNGGKREDFALADLFGASYVSTADHTGRFSPCRIKLDPHPITDDPVIRENMQTAWLQPDNPVYGMMTAPGQFAVCTPHPGAQALGTWRDWDNKEQHPLMFVSTYGKGKSVYFSGSIDQAYYTYGNSFTRRLLCNAVRYAASADASVKVEAPLAVQATFYTQKDERRVIVHLLNDQSSWGRHSLGTGGSRRYVPEASEGSIGAVLDSLVGSPTPGGRYYRREHTWPVRQEVIPVHDIKVTFKDTNVKQVYLIPGKSALPTRKVKDGIQVTVPSVDIHAMVVAEYGKR